MESTHFLCFILVFVPTVLSFRDGLAFAGQYDNHRVETRSARRYCGSEITRTLNFLCESYNKRSPYPALNDRNLDQENDINGEMDEASERPVRYPLTLVNLLRNVEDMKYYHRKIRGVVDDCCKRSCTTTQLAQYCDVVRIATTTPAAD